MIGATQTKNNKAFELDKDVENQWCPGCGNFPILLTLKKALAEAGCSPENTVLVSGIGQAAKLPQYVQSHYFNGLHGRALPVATGIKAANPRMNVLVTSGDGDVYGEGGGHLIHTIRRNPNIAVLVHDNMIYGLTKGQASPTSPKELVTPTQPRGVYNEPFNPLTLAISLDAPFVARASAGEPEMTKEIIKQAIAHPGFALVDIFQPCIVFNKKNTYQWFKEHTKVLDESHDPTDRAQAFAVAMADDEFALGVISAHHRRAVYEESVGIYDDDRRALYERENDWSMIEALLRTRV